MNDPVRVLVVADSTFVRRAVARTLDGGPETEVAGNAADGAEAVAMARKLSPDVMVLDINMPHLDGLAALERIMAEAPTRVQVLSTLTRAGAQSTEGAGARCRGLSEQRLPGHHDGY